MFVSFKIKAKIGIALLKMLEQAEVKIIIRKKPWLRTEKELDVLVHYLKQFGIFNKQQLDISYFELRDITRSLQLKKYEQE